MKCRFPLNAGRGHFYAASTLLVCCAALVMPPARAQVGVVFDYGEAEFLLECWNHLWDGGGPDGQENFWYPGPDHGDAASCNGGALPLPGEGFRILAEHSADAAHFGVGVLTGDGETRVSYSAPYTLQRVIRVRRDGGETFLAFPVVAYTLVVDGDYEVEVDGNAGPAESAYIHSMSVTENGGTGDAWVNPTTGNNSDWTVYDDGQRSGSIRLEIPHEPWGAPALIPGDTLSLETYTCPSATTPDLPDWIADECSEPGKQVLIERFPEWNNVELKAQMRARSLDYIFAVRPLLIIIDGGEAIACFGLNSQMGAFDLRCNSEGITATVAAEIIRWEEYRVQRRGIDFKILDPDVPVTAIPALPSLALAFLVVLVGLMGAARLNRSN